MSAHLKQSRRSNYGKRYLIYWAHLMFSYRIEVAIKVAHFCDNVAANFNAEVINLHKFVLGFRLHKVLNS